MAVSRPVLLALLGAVLVGALFFATMGAREPSEGSGAPVSPATEKAGPARAGAAPHKAGSAPGKPASAARKPGSAARKTGSAARKTTTAAPSAVPATVTRALAHRRTVVLFFFQRGSADDDATARAVDSVRRRPGVKVFPVPIKRLVEFRAVTGAAGVSQAPAVLILGRKGRMRLIEGYVDEKTLAQQVADLR